MNTTCMGNENFDLAKKIYEELKNKGAGIGSFSIHIIEKVLDETQPAERSYTQQDLLDTWDAAAAWAMDSYRSTEWAEDTETPDKNQFFSAKFGIDI